MNKPLLIGAAWAAAALVGGLAVAASSANAHAGQYAYETATVDRGDISRIVSASGAVEPITKVDVGSEVSGKIVSLNVDFNSPVKKDEVLAVVDPSSFQSAVDQAAAQLAQAQALVATSKQNIEHSKVALDIAQKNWDRQKALYGQGAIAESDWEAADRDFKFAQVQLLSDQVSLQSANAGLDKANATLEDAKVQLARTSIRSPIDGVVINRAVDLGQTVQSSMTVANFFTIARDLSKIQIEAAVVESDVGGVSEGDAAAFTVDAFPGQRFQGQVTQLRTLGTALNNVVTYTAVIEANNSTGKLMPGMTANAEIMSAHAANVMRVALDATRFQPPRALAAAMGLDPQAPAQARARALAASGEAHPPAGPAAPGAPKRITAYVLDDKGVIQPRQITIGLTDGNNAQIIDGAQPGDQFVTRARPAGEKKAEPAAVQGQSPLSPQQPRGPSPGPGRGG